MYWSDLFLLFEHSCNAVNGQLCLSHCSDSLPPSLRQAGTPVRSLWLDAAFLQARHFDWTGPCCIASVKRRSSWRVFAVMVNEEHDSEFKNMLMTPLEQQFALNLDEAVFPPPPLNSLQKFPTMLVGISLWRWWEMILSRTMNAMCERAHAMDSFFKPFWI